MVWQQVPQGRVEAGALGPQGPQGPGVERIFLAAPESPKEVWAEAAGSRGWWDRGFQ